MEHLSVCVITKNEEKNIHRCLSSVAWADEFIVVDSGSTDDTQKVAHTLGALVIEKPFEGWAKQKNYAIDQSSNDWILSLDADEWLEPEAEQLIREAMKSKNADAYFIRRKTSFLGRFMLHSGWYPDEQIRLFRKSVTSFANVPVHEKVIVPERNSNLALDILHESYTSLSQFIEKNNLYTSAQAELQKDKKFVGVQLIIKPWARFFQVYFLQLGLLDGREGFVLATLRMWYEFMVLAKILELRKTNRQARKDTVK